MMVVSLRRSVPRLLDRVRLGIPDNTVLEQIRRDTSGEWSGISNAAFEKFGQFVVAAHGGRIASMYDITGYGPGEEAGRIRFDVTPAYGFEDLIGQPGAAAGGVSIASCRCPPRPRVLFTEGSWRSYRMQPGTPQ